MGTISSRCNLA